MKLILHIKWGYEKSNFASDQSLSEELKKKQQKEEAELLARLNKMLIKILYRSIVNVKYSVGEN